MDDFWNALGLIFYIVMVIVLIFSGIDILLALFWPLVVIGTIIVLAFVL